MKEQRRRAALGLKACPGIEWRTPELSPLLHLCRVRKITRHSFLSGSLACRYLSPSSTQSHSLARLISRSRPSLVWLSGLSSSLLPSSSQSHSLARLISRSLALSGTRLASLCGWLRDVSSARRSARLSSWR